MVTGTDFYLCPPPITGCDQDWMGRGGAYIWGGSTGGIPGHTLCHRAQPSPLANITPSMGSQRAVGELAVGTGYYSYTTQGKYKLYGNGVYNLCGSTGVAFRLHL